MRTENDESCLMGEKALRRVSWARFVFELDFFLDVSKTHSSKNSVGSGYSGTVAGYSNPGAFHGIQRPHLKLSFHNAFCFDV